MKTILFSILLLLVISCQSDNTQSDNKLCDCIEAGDKVNHISASFFERRPTKAGKDSLMQAKEIRDSMCAPFQDMVPSKLREKAVECESLYYKVE